MTEDGVAQFNKLELGKETSTNATLSGNKLKKEIPSQSQKPSTSNQLKNGLLGWYA